MTRRLPLRELARLVAARPARAGSTRVVAVDGFSGSGKTTLAGLLAAELAAPVVRAEDVVPGWDGLAAGVREVSEQLLEPLARGEPGRLRRFDWYAGVPAGVLEVAPTPVLLVEGCGVLAVPARELLSTALWLDVPAAERSRRLDARDDRDLYAPHRSGWAAQEETLARHGGPRAADLVLRDLDPGRGTVTVTPPPSGAVTVTPPPSGAVTVTTSSPGLPRC